MSTQKIKNKLHNYFDITKISADGTETKYTAYNVVTQSGLDLVFSGIDAASTTLKMTNYIAVGDGVGEPSVSNSKLFNGLDCYSTTLESVGRLGDNTFWGRHVIQIEPNNLVGKTITEVGLSSSSYATSSVNTHAMIKDSQGQTVGIYKTSTDKIVIRATIYITIEHGEDIWHSTGPFCYIPNMGVTKDNMPTEAAQVVANLSTALGSTHYMCTHKFLTNDAYAADFTSYSTATSSISVSKSTTSSYTKKCSTSMGINTGNGYLIHGFLYTYYKSNIGIPIKSLGFNGIEYLDVAVDQGDGDKTIFDIPYSYKNHKSMVVKINGVETQDYEVINAWGVDCMYNAAGMLHCHFYPKPNSENEYYRTVRYHNYSVYSSTNIAATGYNLISKLRWNDEKDMFIFEGESDHVADEYSSGSIVIYKTRPLANYITDEGWWIYDNSKFHLREFDAATGVVGGSKFSISVPDNAVPVKIEGTDLYLGGLDFGRVIDGVWTKVGAIAHSGAKLLWSNPSHDSFGYVGNLLVTGSWGNTSNRLYKWSDESSVYSVVSTAPSDIIGFVSYTKCIGFNSTTHQLTEYTVDGELNVTSNRVIMENVKNAACIWLPKEQEGIIIATSTSYETSAFTLSLDKTTGEYLTVRTQGLPLINDSDTNSSHALNVAGEWGGTINCCHPRDGYLAGKKHIRKIPCAIKFKTPPEEGASITIDVVNKYLLKDGNLTLAADWYMSCQ